MASAEETPLGRWKLRHGLTYDQVGQRLGIDPQYARKLGCGALRPSPKLAEQIEAQSNGELRKEELVFPATDHPVAESAPDATVSS